MNKRYPLSLNYGRDALVEVQDVGLFDSCDEAIERLGECDPKRDFINECHARGDHAQWLKDRFYEYDVSEVFMDESGEYVERYGDVLEIKRFDWEQFMELENER